jgi:hypothetical protein
LKTINTKTIPIPHQQVLPVLGHTTSLLKKNSQWKLTAWYINPDDAALIRVISTHNDVSSNVHAKGI